jgi:non-specific protein-tyrosine kinase
VRPPLDEHLVAFHHVTSPATEQYRKLHVEIVRAGQIRELRTLLIASALAGEGKTTTALNLAITMAASGGEGPVLLVETDFRRPGVQQYLGTRVEAGLANYLLGEVDLSQLFVKTPIPGLTVVPMGRRVENPTALVTSQKMAQFFQAVAAPERYRYILLDSSPILLTSETKVLALHADAVILVVQAGKTPRDMVVKAIDVVGAENILGCVFNRMTAVDSDAYRYYYSAEYFTGQP